MIDAVRISSSDDDGKPGMIRGSGKYECIRQLTLDRTEDDIQQSYKDMMSVVGKIESSIKENDFPRYGHFNACSCNDFGQCPYQILCQAQPEDVEFLVEQNFSKKKDVEIEEQSV